MQLQNRFRLNKKRSRRANSPVATGSAIFLCGGDLHPLCGPERGRHCKMPIRMNISGPEIVNSEGDRGEDFKYVFKLS
jgi:hypothetical protein